MARQRAKSYLDVAMDFDGRFPQGERYIGRVEDSLIRCNVRQRTREAVLKTAMLRTLNEGKRVGFAYFDGNFWLGEFVGEALKRRRIRCQIP